MLYLNRSAGKSIVLKLPDGRSVRVVMIGTQRRQGELRAQLGVEAPPDVVVRRGELSAAQVIALRGQKEGAP